GWTRPAADGGTPLTGYRVTASPGGVVALAGPNATSVAVGPLTNGASYSFSVSALNAMGTGSPATSPPPSSSPRLAGVERVGGAGPVETAVALSRRAFSGAADVVIARSDDYADALAASALAGDLSAPLLLTPSGSLSPSVASEVRRLRATTAYLAGGTTALSAGVEAGLRAAGASVTRFAGVNRFDTARLLAERVGGRSVYVAEGANADPNRGWADAVAVSGLAAFQARPVLLTNAGELPAETRAALLSLGATSATVVGGTVAVSTAVASAVGDPDDNGVAQVSVSRLGGATRFETARLLADRALSAGAGVHRLWMATLTDWPDALVAGPAAANKGAVVLLLDGGDLANSTAASSWLAAQNRRFLEAVVVGDTASITSGVETAVSALLR
ncbi:MAG: cell wall-binding repeat-containing protein, partial [Acidimicrobiales bacterium]